MLRARTLASAAWLFGAAFWLVIAGHHSGAPVVLGRWSRSLAIVVAAGGAALVVAGAFLAFLWLASQRWEPRLRVLLQAIRGRGWLAASMALAPLVAWAAALAYLANVDLPFMERAWAGFAALSGLLLAWLALLLLADSPPATRKTLALKLALLAVSAGAPMVVVEAAGRTWLGGRASGNLNPPALDVRFQTDEFDTRVVTNRQGLREPAAIGPKPSGEIRVAFIGDSMTFGWGVEADETFAVLSEALWHDRWPGTFVRSINAGKPGAALPDYLRVLRDDAPKWKPDWIVIGFLVGNDCPVTPPVSLASDQAVQSALEGHLHRSQKDRLSAELQKSILLGMIHRTTQRVTGALQARFNDGVNGPLFGEPNPLDREVLEAQLATPHEKDEFAGRFDMLTRTGWIDRGRQWRANPWLIRSALLDPRGVVRALGEETATLNRLRNEWRLCEALFDEAKTIAESHGAQLCIVAIPSPFQVSSECRRFLQQLGCPAPDSLAEAKTVNAWLAEYGARKGILVVDPLDDFLNAVDADSLYYAIDVHLTAAGHRLLAERLVEELPLVGEEPGNE